MPLDLLSALFGIACLGGFVFGLVPDVWVAVRGMLRFFRWSCATHLRSPGKRAARSGDSTSAEPAQKTGAQSPEHAPLGVPTEVVGVLRSAHASQKVVLATATPNSNTACIQNNKTFSTKAPDIWIETSFGNVALGGEIFVAVGSKEVEQGQKQAKLEGSLGEMAAVLCSLSKCPIRCLSLGDKVRAVGQLEAQQDETAPSNYRSLPVRHCLVPAPPNNVVVIGATRPPKAVIAFGSRARFGFFGATLCATISFFALQALWAKEAPSPIRFNAANDIDRLLEQHHYEDAAELANISHDHARAAKAFFLSGDLINAATSFSRVRDQLMDIPPSIGELDSQIAAHNFERAAMVSKALAARNEKLRGDYLCLAEVLMKVENPPTDDRFPAADFDCQKGYLCSLAHANLVQNQKTNNTLKNIVATLDFGFMRPGPPPEPRAFDMDARVAAYILMGRRDLARWPFLLPPYPGHIAMMRGPVFEMPLFALETGNFSVPSTGEAFERSLTMAIWNSFLGDHLAAANDLRTAAIRLNLPEAAPKESLKVGSLFEPAAIHLLLEKKPPQAFHEGLEHDLATSLFGVGAALALRANESDHAAAYIDLLPEEDDPTDIRSLLWAFNEDKHPAQSHLDEVAYSRERALVEAAEAQFPSELIRVLESTQGQGLWPIAVKRASPAALEGATLWARGFEPSATVDLGFYGLLKDIAGRRAAAQALGRNDLDDVLAKRIARLRGPLTDRSALVFLYVSGRLAMPD